MGTVDVGAVVVGDEAAVMVQFDSSSVESVVVSESVPTGSGVHEMYASSISYGQVSSVTLEVSVEYMSCPQVKYWVVPVVEGVNRIEDVPVSKSPIFQFDGQPDTSEATSINTGDRAGSVSGVRVYAITLDGAKSAIVSTDNILRRIYRTNEIPPWCRGSRLSPAMLVHWGISLAHRHATGPGRISLAGSTTCPLPGFRRVYEP